MRLRVALLAAAASLVASAPAAASTYTVTGFGDSLSGTCQPAGEGAVSCTTLRAAVQSANEGADEDTIALSAGTYVVNSGQIVINQTVTVAGAGARATVIDATGNGAPTFTVSGQDITLGNLTVRGGSGANVSVVPGGDLGLAFTRLTGAQTGVGAVNEGTLTVTFSLIDGNPSGGINNVGGSGAATVTVGGSTIASNGGHGIASTGDPQNVVDLIHTTIARNAGAGLIFASGHQPGSADASILADNSVNCSGGTLVGQLNVESTTSCALDAGTNRVVSDPLLAGALSNQGGFTDVLTIPANSPAADYVSPCFLLLDQRGFTRPSGQPCDAGAYDREAVDPGIIVPPPPDPPAPPPPAPTPSPAPTPVPNQSVVGDEERGTVKVKLPGTSTFVDLNDVKSLPNGTEIDTRKGAIKLRAVPKPGAPVEEALFYDGLFKLKQSGGITTLTLSEALDCGKAKGKKASAAAKKAKKRKLWGDGKGSFRTQGKYSAATVRGTRWLVEDTCTSTTVTVRQGTVFATDRKGKRVIVRPGKPFVVRAKK